MKVSYAKLLLTGLLAACVAAGQEKTTQAEPEVPRGSEAAAASGQQAPTAVPRLIKFSGAFKDRVGRPLSGVVGVSFALYKEREGGLPVWLELQNVELDEQGRYAALLGAATPEALPLDLFTGGEPRWLGVQVQIPGEEEQSRVLLVSVPYALKAGDAETLGGRPLSAFVLAQPPGPAEPGGLTPPASKDTAGLPRNNITIPTAAATTDNYLTKYSTGNDLERSLVYETVSGNIGIGTTGPEYRLDVYKGGDTHNYAARVTGGYNIDAHGLWVFVQNPFATQEILKLSSTGGGGGDAFLVYGNKRAYFGGNVGIGTTEPGYRLEVAGGPINAKSGLLYLQRDLTDLAARRNWGWITEVSSAGDVALLESTANNTAPSVPRITVLSGGNVGIGTTGPASLLSLGLSYGEGIANKFRIYDDGSASTSDTSNSSGIGVRGFDGRISYTAGVGGYHAFYTANTERMRITSGGNVGIGTPPLMTEKLEVAGNVKLTGTGNGIIFPDGSLQVTACGPIGFGDGRELQRRVTEALAPYKQQISDLRAEMQNLKDTIALLRNAAGKQ